jgi:hypothetical protein
VKKLTTLFSPNLHLQRMIGFLFIRRLPEMLTAYREGRDLHALTAQSPTGREDISKNDRKLAKAVNLGLLYGMGAKGLQAYTLAMRRHRDPDTHRQTAKRGAKATRPAEHAGTGHGGRRPEARPSLPLRETL